MGWSSRAAASTAARKWASSRPTSRTHSSAATSRRRCARNSSACWRSGRGGFETRPYIRSRRWRRQRLLDRRLQCRFQVVYSDRANQFIADARITTHHEGLRHAVDAPFDCRATIVIGPVGHERVAVTAEKAPGVLGLVLVVDARDPNALVGRQPQE